jgi:hypothetical protein
MYNDGTLGFWPVLLDGASGRALDNWNQSAHLIAEAAKESWTMIMSGEDSYQKATAPDDKSYNLPKWPKEEELPALLARAIASVLVRNLDHAEMQRWLRPQ